MKQLLIFYIEAVVSFDKTSYTVEEKQGAVDVTLNLDKPIPFTDYTVNLTINDDTTSELYFRKCMCNWVLRGFLTLCTVICSTNITGRVKLHKIAQNCTKLCTKAQNWNSTKLWRENFGRFNEMNVIH